MKGGRIRPGERGLHGLEGGQGPEEHASVAGTALTLLSFSETLSQPSTAPCFSKAVSSFLIEKPSFNF